MGCFSYLCSECGKPINSDSETGQECIMFLMKDGECIEWMCGMYDSYGGVYGERWESMPWNDICDMQFGPTNDGIAAYHHGCRRFGMHRDDAEKSDNDPEQGWGGYSVPENPIVEHWTKTDDD